jgi:hypothetical protein
VAKRSGSATPRSIVSFFVDANASAGMGVHARDRPAGAGRSFVLFGVRHVNKAGQDVREFLQGRRLASAATFFRARRGGGHAAGWHPQTSKGYQLGHWLCRQEQVGRMQDARLRPLLAADSDHMLVVFVLRTGRMAQVQRPPRAKPTNIEALLWVCYLGNHFFLYRQSEAVNEKHCYEVHARSGLRFIIRHQEDA